MKKSLVLSAIFTMFLMAGSVAAQGKFSGNWKLDKNKSELGERSRVESMTMNVVQTDGDIKYERKAKRAEGGQGGGRGRRGGRGLQPSGPISFKLDGSVASSDIDRGMITGTVKRKGEAKEGKLVLTTNTTLETPRGERKISGIETWELSEDGKMLTILSERETPRGTRTSKMVFVKE